MPIDWIRRSQDLVLQVRDFIDGRHSEGSGKALGKYGPRDGRLLCEFGAGDARDADRAVFSARRAFEDGRWSKLTTQRRKVVLHKLASLIDVHREELALLECIDVGKPIEDALNIDIPMAAGTIRSSAEYADKIFGDVYAADQFNLSYQLRRPIGVVTGIVGWNFPLVLAASKLGPALATGNCLILKPSELTSFTAGRLAELAMEAGVPEGVVNVIHGNSDMGAALAHHPKVDLITFTGSTQTGKKLLIASGQSNMKRLILECGGKAANIVFDDCPELDGLADAIVARSFWNQGQVCTASSRLLVQEGIKEALLPLILQKVRAFAPGDPLRSETKFGALVSREHQRKVLSYIESGKYGGAKVIYDGKSLIPHDCGFYVAPIIFDSVTEDQKIAQEEIFGPVLSVISFRDEEEAVRIANGTIYGLSAIVWTKDLARAHRVCQRLRVGWIVVNATAKPTGGPDAGIISVGGHKESGVGVEGGLEGLKGYTSQTAVQLYV